MTHQDELRAKLIESSMSKTFCTYSIIGTTKEEIVRLLRRLKDESRRLKAPGGVPGMAWVSKDLAAPPDHDS